MSPYVASLFLTTASPSRPTDRNSDLQLQQLHLLSHRATKAPGWGRGTGGGGASGGVWQCQAGPVSVADAVVRGGLDTSTFRSLLSCLALLARSSDTPLLLRQSNYS